MSKKDNTMEAKTITFEQVISVFEHLFSGNDQNWPAETSEKDRARQTAEYFWESIHKEE